MDDFSVLRQKLKMEINYNAELEIPAECTSIVKPKIPKYAKKGFNSYCASEPQADIGPHSCSELSSEDVNSDFFSVYESLLRLQHTRNVTNPTGMLKIEDEKLFQQTNIDTIMDDSDFRQKVKMDINYNAELDIPADFTSTVIPKIPKYAKKGFKSYCASEPQALFYTDIGTHSSSELSSEDVNIDLFSNYETFLRLRHTRNVTNPTDMLKIEAEEPDIGKRRQRLEEINDNTRKVIRISSIKEQGEKLPIELIMASVVIHEDPKYAKIGCNSNRTSVIQTSYCSSESDTERFSNSESYLEDAKSDSYRDLDTFLCARHTRDVANPTDMLKIDGKVVNHISMLGEAAHGKTTYCMWLLKKWCNAQQRDGIESKEHDNWTKATEALFDYDFQLQFRSKNPYRACVIEMICQDVFGIDNGDSVAIHHLLQIVLSDKFRSRIIMDGLNDWNPNIEIRKQPTCKGTPTMKTHYLQLMKAVMNSGPKKARQMLLQVHGSDNKCETDHSSRATSNQTCSNAATDISITANVKVEEADDHNDELNSKESRYAKEVFDILVLGGLHSGIYLPLNVTNRHTVRSPAQFFEKQTKEEMVHYLHLRYQSAVANCVKDSELSKTIGKTCCGRKIHLHKNGKAHYGQCRLCLDTAFHEVTVYHLNGHHQGQEALVEEKKAEIDEFFDILSVCVSLDDPAFESLLRLVILYQQCKIICCAFQIILCYVALIFLCSEPLRVLALKPSRKILGKVLPLISKNGLPKREGDLKSDKAWVLKNNAYKSGSTAVIVAYVCACFYQTQLLRENFKEDDKQYGEQKAAKLYKLLQEALAKKELLKKLVQPYGNNVHTSPRDIVENNVHISHRDIVAYPAFDQVCQRNTLDPILERFSTSDPPNRHETMSFELLRLCTLHDFPFKNAPSLVRLTQAGFYYEGNDDEVICFSCNVRKRNWNINDDPMDVHRKLSPNCPFVNGTGAQNVPVNSHSGNLNTQSMQQLNTADGPNVSAGTHQAPELQTDHFEQTPEAVTSASSASMVAKDSAIAHGGNMAMSQTASHGSQISNSTDSGISSTPTAVTSTTSLSQHPRTAPPNSYQPAGNTRPMKYPQYADKTVRLDTYKDWPTRNTQHPRDMTEAGFYFTGNGDCARCFQCGIGLKNWDPLDNPWVEHARWSPRCSYLLEIKGQDFIDLVMDAAERANREAQNQANNMSQTSERTGPSNTAQNVEKDCAPRAVTQDGGTDTDPASVTTSAVRDVNQVPKFPLQAPAAQSVISQGYPPKIVKIAVDALIERIGWPSVTADAILQELNDSGYASSSGSQGASASTTSEGDNFGNSEFKISKDKNILQSENKELKELTTCKICLDERVSIVFLPCGHLVSCAQCAPAMRKCPICRTLVKGTVRTCLMDG